MNKEHAIAKLFKIMQEDVAETGCLSDLYLLKLIAAHREDIEGIIKECERMYKGKRELSSDDASFQARIDDHDFGYDAVIESVVDLLKDKI